MRAECASPPAAIPADIAAASRHMFSIADKNLWANTWWLDPVMLGQYPADGLKIFEGRCRRSRLAT